jgi:hypothetical protein
MTPGTQVVYGVRCELFSGARSALYQNITLAVGDERDQLENLLHRGTLAYYVFEHVGAEQTLAKLCHRRQVAEHFHTTQNAAVGVDQGGRGNGYGQFPVVLGDDRDFYGLASLACFDASFQPTFDLANIRPEDLVTRLAEDFIPAISRQHFRHLVERSYQTFGIDRKYTVGNRVENQGKKSAVQFLSSHFSPLNFAGK